MDEIHKLVQYHQAWPRQPPSHEDSMKRPRTHEIHDPLTEKHSRQSQKDYKGKGIIKGHSPPYDKINMITSGAIDGHSNRARKACEWWLEVYRVKGEVPRGPVISFGLEDLLGVNTLHSDALVIQAIIANYLVARVFVDTGSSINIIFEEAFDWMQVGVVEL